MTESEKSMGAGAAAHGEWCVWRWAESKKEVRGSVTESEKSMGTGAAAHGEWCVVALG